VTLYAIAAGLVFSAMTAAISDNRAQWVMLYRTSLEFEDRERVER
jgi:hypothetical protein